MLRPQRVAGAMLLPTPFQRAILVAASAMLARCASAAARLPRRALTQRLLRNEPRAVYTARATSAAARAMKTAKPRLCSLCAVPHRSVPAPGALPPRGTCRCAAARHARHACCCQRQAPARSVLYTRSAMRAPLSPRRRQEARCRPLRDDADSASTQKSAQRYARNAAKVRISSAQHAATTPAATACRLL